MTLRDYCETTPEWLYKKVKIKSQDGEEATVILTGFVLGCSEDWEVIEEAK